MTRFIDDLRTHAREISDESESLLKIWEFPKILGNARQAIFEPMEDLAELLGLNGRTRATTLGPATLRRLAECNAAIERAYNELATALDALQHQGPTPEEDRAEGGNG